VECRAGHRRSLRFGLIIEHPSTFQLSRNMTKVNAPADLPHPVSAFLNAFYRASDTSPAENPRAHELYADFFLPNSPLLMGPNTFNGREGFIKFREQGWEKVSSRRHVVLDVFPSALPSPLPLCYHPSSHTRPSHATSIRTLFSPPQASEKHPKRHAADWAGHMKLNYLEDEGGYKLAFYQVWIVSRLVYVDNS
jgi:hypothetical protein